MMNIKDDNNAKLMDPYYIGYHIMIESLEHNNVFNGLSKSLSLAKLYLQCDDIILYKLKEENEYEKFNNTYSNNGYEVIIELLNKRKNKIFEQDFIEINLDDEEIKKITFLPIVFRDLKYMLVVINSKINSNKQNEFMNILKESFKVILDKMESYHNILKMTYHDASTTLENRLSYNMKAEEYDRVNQHVTFVMIDLFRLKYINDNFGHLMGDLYIKEVANILKKYFPNSRFNSNSYNMSNNIETGDHVYRIGGDEYVVLSQHKTTEQMEKIFKMISYEVSNLNLGIGNDVPIHINYGISERFNDEKMEELYKLADDRLSIDKREMYKTLRINRRK